MRVHKYLVEMVNVTVKVNGEKIKDYTKVASAPRGRGGGGGYGGGYGGGGGGVVAGSAVRPANYKTVLCKHFMTPGKACFRGATCPFAHGHHDLRY